MSKPILSDAQIKRRKKAQARISQATGALGLGAAGAFAAGRLGGSGKVATKAQKVVPVLRKINPTKADKVSLGLSTSGGALGAAGSFNFARYTDAEARKRSVSRQKIQKRYDDYQSPFEDGFYGVCVERHD